MEVMYMPINFKPSAVSPIMPSHFNADFFLQKLTGFGVFQGEKNPKTKGEKGLSVHLCFIGMFQIGQNKSFPPSC